MAVCLFLRVLLVVLWSIIVAVPVYTHVTFLIIGPEVIKLIFMLRSTEHGISSAHKN